MPTFTYKGATQDGKPIEDTVEAADRYAVYDIARSLGRTVVSVEEQRQFSLAHSFDFERVFSFLSYVRQDEVVTLSRNLSAMIRAGLALTRALSVSERQTRNPAFKRVLGGLRDEVQKGKAFHEVLKLYPRVFSRLYVAMVRAGEEGGTLAEALHTVGVQLEQSSNLRKKIRGAMIYPAVVLTAMFAIGFLMMVYVVPTLTATFKELKMELPLTTKLIIMASDFLSQYTLAALLAAIGVVVLGIVLYRTPAGRAGFERILLRTPLIGKLVREANAARTARTLSSLLRSGVDVVGALSITKDVVQNTFYRRILAEAAEHVEKGKPLSEDFSAHEDLYPPLVGEMTAVGEETGQIAEMLEEVASFYESEIERQTKDLSTIIEPALMLVIGGAVGFFALSMISPIYSISDGIK